jgi:hypothetical protein
VDLIDKPPEKGTRPLIDIANTIQGKTPFHVHVEEFNASCLKRLLEDYSKGQRLRSSPSGLKTLTSNIQLQSKRWSMFGPEGSSASTHRVVRSKPNPNETTNDGTLQIDSNALNWRDRHGQTACHYALLKPIYIRQRLHRAGADPTISLPNSQSECVMAFRSRLEESLRDWDPSRSERYGHDEIKALLGWTSDGI